MTAVQTLRDPKTERLTDGFTSQNRVETDEPEETPLERYRRWRLKVDKREQREGTFDVELPTMEEIVAICKEVRAERYVEEQAIAHRH